MTRHEVGLLKAFASALKGHITAQRYLLETFKRTEESVGYVELWPEQWAGRDCRKFYV